MLEAPPTTQAAVSGRVVAFSRPTSSAAGLAGVERAIATGQVKAGGPATKRCERRLTKQLGAPGVLMVGSCTAALELSALLLGIGPGDEVIMPSFGFSSAANAFVLRGATPVFVDILPGTLTADPCQVAAATTAKTKAIMPVHYAGVAAGFDDISALAGDRGIPVIEDAAQAIGATCGGRPLGTLGTLGTISFDATKNISCGAGGALVVNDFRLLERAEWLRDCGTDRAGFSRGLVDRYRWVDAGSNYALNEIAAAYLAPQLDRIDATTQTRRAIWSRYDEAFRDAEGDGLLERPVVPTDCSHNGHAYVVMLPAADSRARVLRALNERGVEASFHFVPLHSSPAGRRFGRTHGTDGALPRTDDLSARLVRLPLWEGMSPADTEYVIDAVYAVLQGEGAVR